MPEHTDKPERDTSPSGEISARQNDDGTYEIVAGDSSSANAVPESDATASESKASAERKDGEGASIRSPITIALLVLTLLAAGGTVAYFASGSSDDDQQASGEEDLSFRPYAGDEAPPEESVQEPEAAEQAAAEDDASSVDDDAGPKERKTEIIVLEEEVDEVEEQPADNGAPEPTVDESKFQKIEVGPGTAARIRDSVQLKVDPAKLRDIKFTNGETPEAEGQEVRDRDKSEVDSEGSVDGEPSEDLEEQVEDPVIE